MRTRTLSSPVPHPPTTASVEPKIHRDTCRLAELSVDEIHARGRDGSGGAFLDDVGRLFQECRLAVMSVSFSVGPRPGLAPVTSVVAPSFFISEPFVSGHA